MTSSLASGSCEPCKRTTPALQQTEIEQKLQELGSEWQLKPFHGSDKLSVLQKQFNFKNFRTALAFTNSLGEMAEKEKHHPEILLGWGHVDVAWWSHAIQGLHTNDFICAAKSEELAKTAEGRKLS